MCKLFLVVYRWHWNSWPGGWPTWGCSEHEVLEEIQYFTNDFCSSLRRVLCLYCKWISTFRISSAFTQPWRRMANPLLYLKKTKWNDRNFCGCCGEHAYSLWKTARRTVAVWEEKYSCQFDPRECLKLAFSCYWLRWRLTQLASWRLSNDPSSKGFKLCEMYEFQPKTRKALHPSPT